jgi:hypothetical protein
MSTIILKIAVTLSWTGYIGLNLWLWNSGAKDAQT